MRGVQCQPWSLADIATSVIIVVKVVVVVVVRGKVFKVPTVQLRDLFPSVVGRDDISSNAALVARGLD